MHRILISEKLAPRGIEILKEKAEVDYRPEISREEFLNIIDQYEALIIRSMTKINQKALNRATNLKVIGRAGTGYDNIDIDAATRKGIVVFNTPFGNTISAVEHTMGLMLALSRNIVQANNALHRGKWNRTRYMGQELKGKSLAIIGLGKIGSRVARRAKSFGMKVIANDPYLPREKAENMNIPLLSFKEALENADYVSLHTPLTEETFHILSYKEFAIMKNDAYVINCARGKNINTSALAEALKQNKIAGAAIDVHEQEPFQPEDNPLLKFPDRVIMTCHLGGTTSEAMDNVSIKAALQVLEVLNNKLPDSPLNIPALRGEDYQTLAPYLELATRLGNFIAYWKGEERIKALEIEYGGKFLDFNTRPFTLNLVKSIFSPILDDRVNIVNALLVARERGITIKESQLEKPEELNNIIHIYFQTDKGNYSLAGSYQPIGNRVIKINNCRIDMELAGKFIIATYRDQPGVIGEIGTILGNNNINIASMQVGRKLEGGEAVMIIQTDSKPGPEILEKIKNNCAKAELTGLNYMEL
ncbi:MAG: phosphoglycerate dehydrogenase [Halanaerobiales bacterium]